MESVGGLRVNPTKRLCRTFWGGQLPLAGVKHPWLPPPVKYSPGSRLHRESTQIMLHLSHSFTCHPHTNHTCLYSPAARRHRPSDDTHFAYQRRDGQAELAWVAGYIWGVKPADTITHSSTNRARRRRRLTSSIETNALPLRQTTT